MQNQKLEISQIAHGLWDFVKQQFKRLDTWVMISVLTYLMILGLTLLMLFIIGLEALVVISQIKFFGLLVNFQNNFKAIILILLMTILTLFVSYKIIKKMIGFVTVLMLNGLAAAQDKTLPKFSLRDERFSLIFYGFLSYFLIILGFVLLIIPGVIFSVRFYFGYLIMLDEKCSPIQALKKSWKLTENHFWTIFIFILPLYIFTMIPYIYIIFLFIPLNTWLQAYMYEQLKKVNQ